MSSPKNAWFDAHVILTSWIALSVVCGLYLLGLFRTEGDHGDVKVGTGRIIFGAVFLGLAIYLAPALFGHPPQSLVWDRLIVGILPPDSAEFAGPARRCRCGKRCRPATRSRPPRPIPPRQKKKKRKFMVSSGE